MARITGRQQVIARLHGMIGEQAIKEVGQALFESAEMIRAEAAHMITEGSVSGKNHVVSLPHEPPNNDSGVLVAHLESAQTGPLRAEASSNAPYAIPLELGTSKMIERPSMGPATQRMRPKIIERVREAVNRNTRRA